MLPSADTAAMLFWALSLPHGENGGFESVRLPHLSATKNETPKFARRDRAPNRELPARLCDTETEPPLAHAPCSRALGVKTIKPRKNKDWLAEDAVRSETVSAGRLSLQFAICRVIFRNCRESDPFACQCSP